VRIHYVFDRLLFSCDGHIKGCTKAAALLASRMSAAARKRLRVTSLRRPLVRLELVQLVRIRYFGEFERLSSAATAAAKTVALLAARAAGVREPSRPLPCYVVWREAVGESHLAMLLRLLRALSYRRPGQLA